MSCEVNKYEALEAEASALSHYGIYRHHSHKREETVRISTLRTLCCVQ